MYIAQHLQRMSFLIFGMILAGSILSATGSEAATYYVATDGNDTNPGTATQPFRTIGQGISLLQASDTLYIKSGTYDESIDSNTITIPTGTSFSNPVTIAANPGETVTLRPSSTYSGAVIALAASYVQYVIFDGLSIDAVNAGEDGISMTDGANHVRFQNGEVKNSPQVGIFLAHGPGGEASDNEFINMKIHGHASHGLYILTSRNLIENSEIYNNAGWGVHIYTGTSEQRANNNTVRDSIARNNGSQGRWSAGILLGSGSGNIADGNLVSENLSNGIEVGYDAVDSKVDNNTIRNNGGIGIVVEQATNTDIRNNSLDQNGAPTYDAGIGTTWN
jgi:parallel beta-helix repeat protein